MQYIYIIINNITRLLLVHPIFFDTQIHEKIIYLHYLHDDSQNSNYIPKKRFFSVETFSIFHPQYRHYIFNIFQFLFLFSVKRFSINAVHQRTMNRRVRVCAKFQLPTFEILPATYMFARLLIMLRFYNSIVLLASRSALYAG